jgi:DNA polymerase I-like protein with 3'-5' exonuclease and polymerase domains
MKPYFLLDYDSVEGERLLLDFKKTQGIEEMAISHAFDVGKLDLASARARIAVEVQEFQPTHIIAFGDLSAQLFFAKKSKMKSLRNRWFMFGTYPVGFTYSPAAIKYNPYVRYTLRDDLIFFAGPVVQAGFTDYRIVTDLVSLQEYLSFDIETNDLSPWEPHSEIVCCAVSRAPGIARVKEGFIENGSIASCVLIGSNIKFDLLWAKVFGVDLSANKIFDLKVAFSLDDENMPDNSLKHHAAIHTSLGHYGDDIKPYLKGSPNRIREFPIEKRQEYNLKDADASRQLYDVATKKLVDGGYMPLFELLMDVEKALVDIEYRGTYIDQAWAKRVGDDIALKGDTAKGILDDISPINYASPPQLRKLMYEGMGLPVLDRTKKGFPATNKWALMALKHTKLHAEQLTLVDALLDYRKYEKLMNTYFNPLGTYVKGDGRIHTTYNLGRGYSSRDKDEGSVSRLSSSNPNLQNIPQGSEIRGMFAATPGQQWWDADYSQLELRVAAYLAQDRAMMKIFDDGLDIHTGVLAQLMKKPYDYLVDIFKDDKHPEYEHWKRLRIVIKRLNFGILYGIGPKKLGKLLLYEAGIEMGYEEIKKLMDAWFTLYHGVRRWIKGTERWIVEGQEIRSPLNRTRHLWGASFDSALGRRILRQGVNFPIQSLAADITLTALLLLHRHKMNLLLTVHDSIAGESGPELAIEPTVRRIMEHDVVGELKSRFGFEFNVPLVIDFHTGDRWS